MGPDAGSGHVVEGGIGEEEGRMPPAELARCAGTEAVGSMSTESAMLEEVEAAEVVGCGPGVGALCTVPCATLCLWSKL